VDKLKTSLEDAMGSHKKAMDDNERLLIDLKKANIQNRVGNTCRRTNTKQEEYFPLNLYVLFEQKVLLKFVCL